MVKSRLVYSDDLWCILKEYFQIPESLQDMTFSISTASIVTCTASFNLTWRHKRSLEETVRDIENGLRECTEIRRRL